MLLAIPVVALLLGEQLRRETPRLCGFPFFFWYQFLWVFLCSGCTYTAYRLVLAARKPGRARPATHRPRAGDGDR